MKFSSLFLLSTRHALSVHVLGCGMNVLDMQHWHPVFVLQVTMRLTMKRELFMQLRTWKLMCLAQSRWLTRVKSIGQR